MSKEIYPDNRMEHSDNDLNNLSLSDLINNRAAFRTITKLLDVKIALNSQYSWETLASFLQDKLYIKDLSVESLLRLTCDVGEVGYYFLKRLNNKQDVSVAKFIEEATSLERSDISLMLKQEDEKTMRQLDNDLLKKIGTEMQNQPRGVCGWKDFADRFGYTSNEIKIMANNASDKISGGPSEELFYLLQQQHEDISLAIIVEGLKSDRVVRNDVVKELKKLIPAIKATLQQMATGSSTTVISQTKDTDIEVVYAPSKTVEPYEDEVDTSTMRGFINVTYEKGGCLLCLDGGGVKGVIESITLMAIQYCINRCFKGKVSDLLDRLNRFLHLPIEDQFGSLIADNDELPRMDKMFDVIIGTSTGAIVATSLGRLYYSPAMICKEFVDLSPIIFGNKVWAASIRKAGKTAQYSHKELEKYLQDKLSGITWSGEFGDAELGIVSLKETDNTSGGTGYSVYCFDSKKYAKSKVKIWQAIRASTAAPTFFDPITIKDDTDGNKETTFIDGGMKSNCPVVEGYTLIKENKEFPLNTSCLISVGCGVANDTDPIETGVGTLTKAVEFTCDPDSNWQNFIKCNSENEAGRFRFNPDASSELHKYKLDCFDDVVPMRERYLKWLRNEEELPEVVLYKDNILRAAKVIFAKSLYIHNVRINNQVEVNLPPMLETVDIDVGFKAYGNYRIMIAEGLPVPVTVTTCGNVDGQSNEIVVSVSCNYRQRFLMGEGVFIWIKFEGVDINGSPIKLKYKEYETE